MRRLISLLLVIGFMLLTLVDYPSPIVYPWARTTFSFGFLLLSAYLLGDVLSEFKMPKIQRLLVW